MAITKNDNLQTVYVSCREEAEHTIHQGKQCVLVLQYLNAHLDTLELAILAKLIGILVQACGFASIGIE